MRDEAVVDDGHGEVKIVVEAIMKVMRNSLVWKMYSMKNKYMKNIIFLCVTLPYCTFLINTRCFLKVLYLTDVSAVSAPARHTFLNGHQLQYYHINN